MPFVKLDCGILDSSVWWDRDQRDIFITALLMATPFTPYTPLTQLEVRSLDSAGFTAPAGQLYGFVAAAGLGIAHRAQVTDKEAAYVALEALGNPDENSRSHDFEGRRLIRVDGGYLVLNFGRYREQDRTGAERQAKYRQAKRNAVTDESNAVTPSSNAVTPFTKPLRVTHADADAEAEKNKTKSMGQQTGPSAAKPKKAEPDVQFEALRAIYPKRDGSQRWGDALKHYRARLREGASAAQIEEGVRRYAVFCETRCITGTDKVQQAATFLGTNRGYTEAWAAACVPKAGIHDPKMGGVLR